MSHPDSAKFFVLWLRLLWESCHERAAGEAGCISHRPALVLETVDESVEQRWNVTSERLLLFIVDGHLVANLANAVTGGFSDGVVVR